MSRSICSNGYIWTETRSKPYHVSDVARCSTKTLTDYNARSATPVTMGQMTKFHTLRSRSEGEKTSALDATTMPRTIWKVAITAMIVRYGGSMSDHRTIRPKATSVDGKTMGSTRFRRWFWLHVCFVCGMPSLRGHINYWVGYEFKEYDTDGNFISTNEESKSACCEECYRKLRSGTMHTGINKGGEWGKEAF